MRKLFLPTLALLCIIVGLFHALNSHRQSYRQLDGQAGGSKATGKKKGMINVKLVHSSGPKQQMEAKIIQPLGAKVVLAIEAEKKNAPDAQLSQIQWEISGTNNIVKSVDLSEEKGFVTDHKLSLNKDTISFYWVKAGTFTVTAKAKLEGTYFEIAKQYVVVAPELRILEARILEVTVSDNYVSPETQREVLALSLGGVREPQTQGTTEGFRILAEVEATPYFEAQFAIVQTVQSRRSKRFRGQSDAKVLSDSKKMQLDEVLPYGMDGINITGRESQSLRYKEVPGERDNSQITVSPKESKAFLHDDSPSTYLRTSPGFKDCIEAEVDESFATYIMYRHGEEGIWMTLWNAKWSWRGIAFLEQGEGDWELRGQMTTLVTTHEIRFPRWRGTVHYDELVYERE